jgi:hypothetical protein
VLVDQRDDGRARIKDFERVFADGIGPPIDAFLRIALKSAPILPRNDAE